MKAVLMSIQPKWCELIASGKKTVEVRKTKPKLETPFKVYIYATKQRKGSLCVAKPVGGKVIGEFVCDKVEQGHILWVKEQPEYYEKTDEKTQLTYRQMLDYLGGKGIGYFWHISDLVIYDKPKELNRFQKPCIRDCDCGGCENAYYTRDYGFEGCALEKGLTRPPQSWCYVEELSDNDKTI